MAPTLDTLPDEVLLDSLAPLLSVQQLLAIAQANHHLQAVFGDNILWRRRIREDFNVPPSVTAREDGWKELYGRLRRPEVYVWGESSNGRLGIRSHAALREIHASYNGVNLPVRLPLDSSVGIVDLQAGGYGFVGLDTKGGVWGWGTLDGSAFPSRSRPDWLKGGAVAAEPRNVLLPTLARAISCGRRHVLILDEEYSVWELTAWGKATKREASSTTDRLIQLDAGWGHSASLSASGRVSVWWPALRSFDDDELASAHTSSSVLGRPLEDSHIDLTFIKTSEGPFVLPDLPADGVAPVHLGDPVRTDKATDKIVKIACGEGFVVALTEKGKVWTCVVGDGQHEIGRTNDGRSVGVWEQHPQFRHPQESHGDPSKRITHISAHFTTFFAYFPGSASDAFASSVVLQGQKGQLRSDEAGPRGAEPIVVQELQGKGVIKVVAGDYHSAAITQDGRLYTWGDYSSGALGLGRTGKVDRPTEVKFDALSTSSSSSAGAKYVFAVTASGWHTGALVLDLSKRAAESSSEAEESERMPSRPVKLASTPNHPTLPTHPDTSRFGAIDPPPSGRPLPGQTVVFPGLTRGAPTPFFGGGVARPPPGADQPRTYTLPVQPSPSLGGHAWAEGRRGPGSLAAAARVGGDRPRDSREPGEGQRPADNQRDE